MTIYAIVNSLFPSSLYEDSGPIWTLISPAAILQGGNPYFVPDFDSRFDAYSLVAARIGKLGKGIAPRFAHRYVDAVAPALLFVAADRLTALRNKGLPWTSAISYDRALAIGKFQPVAFDDIPRCECSIRLEADTVCRESSFRPESRIPDLKEIITAISRDNTLKTGDIILFAMSANGIPVYPGMRAIISIDDREAIRFNIR